MDAPDGRRLVPRTDTVLADPRVEAEVARVGRAAVKTAVRVAQERVRQGEIAPDQVVEDALTLLPAASTTLSPVLNATGVVLHTNLGRAPLSDASLDAIRAAAGYVDVEFDLGSGARARRGRGTLAALRDAVPGAEAVLVVNNGAAALVLATTALAAGREVVVSRGEMVEIGDGFRLPDLIASTGARLREVGTTNRTSLTDYATAVGDETGCILKVHPSNFRVEGFTSSVDVSELAGLGVPVVVDIGSGLLAPDPLLPDEPDATTALRAGAAVVTGSADKLLGGPQGGLVLGRADVVERLRRHPLARALRVDKLALAGLEATLRGPEPPTWRYLRADPAVLRQRTERLAAALGAPVVSSAGVVGGGGAPGLELPGWAVSLPVAYAELLRHQRPAVVARVERGRCLVDLRCVPPADDDVVLAAIRAVAAPLMPVVATAGHVDHGKSTLVRALTGMEPDRWAEERRRGMTIDLGYAWTQLPSGREVAFVDVPGHERFIGNMLAGLGPAPAVLFVVAADEGWSRQSTEHLAAVDALGIRHGLLAVTRSDLADPSQAVSDALARIGRTSLGVVEVVTVSGHTGQGIPDLKDALDQLVTELPPPETDGRVRLWVDRAFTIRGSGTVVTGTLGSGRLSTGDVLDLVTGGGSRRVTVRGLESLRRRAERVDAVARVAVNVRGISVDDVSRGDVLLTPGAWRTTSQLDVRLDVMAADLPVELVLHVGTAAVPVRVRPLGGAVARLTVRAPLPMQAGDRAILRDPAQQVIVSGVLVLDADPPALTRRGAAARRAEELAGATGTPDVAEQVGRRGGVRRRDLVALGVLTESDPLPDGVREVEGWLVAPSTWDAWCSGLAEAVDEHAVANPLAPRMPLEAARRATRIPDLRLVGPVAADAGLEVSAGRVSRPGTQRDLSGAAVALAELESRWEQEPFVAPEHEELRARGLGERELAAVAADGRLLRIADEVVLPLRAPALAMRVLSGLEQPFTVSQARQALGTTRRVAVPLLEHLDARGWTVRIDGNLRRITGR